MTGRGRHFEIRFKGVPLSGGSAIANVCMFDDKKHHTVHAGPIDASEAEVEIERLRAAIGSVGVQLEEIHARVEREVGPAEAGIFAAQKMILEDPALVGNMIAAIRTLNVNAESAASEALNAYETRILALDDAYMKERASDFGELRRRLVDNLTGSSPAAACAEDQCRRGHGRIVVTEELTPYITLELDTGHVLGFVAERGGPSSHAAILARALGIPAVGGVQGIRKHVHCGAEIMVDGDSGEVVVWPSEETLARLTARASARLRVPAPEAPLADVKVMANINLAGDAALALEMKADGIGLYRTEFELIAANRMLSEEELFSRYVKVVSAMEGKKVVFRLPDIGSDKPAPGLESLPEENPALGMRGARLLLRHPHVLAAHARAIARASREGPVAVLYPMIIDAAQFVRLREAFLAAVHGIETGGVSHGAMFEVPSACLDAEAILREADFASIGTNDLIQYLFAADRNNEQVSGEVSTSHPLFWGVVKSLVAAGAARGREVSVCGEIAGEAGNAAMFTDIGIKTLSVSPRRISDLRRALRARRGG
ncbi:MAG: phosphoenolpyruvate--protein phosphotransferase [Lentisphaerae bacterium]|nr:phosphoenolpyruvate--protein phosphotransferase [Lentisphaerota bacterium]